MTCTHIGLLASDVHSARSLSRSPDRFQPLSNDSDQVSIDRITKLPKLFDIDAAFSNFDFAYPTLGTLQPICEFGLRQSSVVTKLTDLSQEGLVLLRVDRRSHPDSWLSQGGITQNRIFLRFV